MGLHERISGLKSGIENFWLKTKKHLAIYAFIRRQKKRNRQILPTVWANEAFAAIDNLGSVDQISDNAKKELIDNLHRGRELYKKKIVRYRLLIAPLTLYLIFNYFGLGEQLTFANVSVDARGLPAAELGILFHTILVTVAHTAIIKAHSIEQMLQKVYLSFYDQAFSQIYLRSLIPDLDPNLFSFKDMPSRTWGRARNWIAKFNKVYTFLRDLFFVLLFCGFYYLAFSKILFDPTWPIPIIWLIITVCILMIFAVLFRLFVFGTLSPFIDWSKIEELKSLMVSDPEQAKLLYDELYGESNKDVEQMCANGYFPKDEDELNRVLSQMSNKYSR